MIKNYKELKKIKSDIEKNTGIIKSKKIELYKLRANTKLEDTKDTEKKVLELEKEIALHESVANLENLEVKSYNQKRKAMKVRFFTICILGLSIATLEFIY